MSTVEQLLDEVRLLWHVASRATERLHRGEPVTLGMRAVLELLARQGPAAVPGIARSRRVTRQHVQALVNDLLRDGLVSLGDNPAHRRSSLVRLEPAGRKVIERMLRRERRFLDGLRPSATREDLRRAAATLGEVRRVLGGRS